MKKILSLTAVLFLFLSTSFSQVIQKRCGTFDEMKVRDQQEPGYLQRVNACFDNAKAIADLNRSNRAAWDTIYRIRCVFHIVYTTPDENIPDSVIYSQIEVLNEDYRRQNADTVKTRAIFKDIAADAGIEFYLATTDPNGQPTNGITRTLGTPGFLGFNPFTDDMKSTATGGIDAWPTDRYLNIWVCNVLNGLGVLGYAFPPDNAPNWPANSGTDSTKQGVVLHYPVVGRNFSAPIDATVAQGKSATHEIGHYLGLRHIWGDGDCTQDDGISDTPLSDAAHQQTCDTSSNTCPDSPTDFPDMIENYMDYSDDRCLNMFTQEQVGIMRAMLQTSRAGIATVVTATGIKNNPYDILQSVSVFPNPSKDQVTLNVQVKNGTVYSYEVFNAIGEKLFGEINIPAAENHHRFNLATQPSGIYLVKVVTAGGTVTKKVQLIR